MAGAAVSGIEEQQFIEAARAFAPVALEFCELFEGEPFAEELWAALETLLPRLYLGGVSLADAAPDDAFTHAEEGEQQFDIVPRLRNEAIDERCDAWASALGDADLLARFTFYGWAPPTVQGGELEPDYDASASRVSDELGVIYANLSGGLVLLDSGLPGTARIASDDWLYSFYAVWGEVVPDLLKAVHSRINTDLDDVHIEAEP
ncbi:MAG: DUF5063 domain-containing protein [Dehalococcoidia bacterium]